MILYEEGKFYLTDPVSKYLPELGDNMKVASVVRTISGLAKDSLLGAGAARITILDRSAIHRVSITQVPRRGRQAPLR